MTDRVYIAIEFLDIGDGYMVIVDLGTPRRLLTRNSRGDVVYFQRIFLFKLPLSIYNNFIKIDNIK